MKVFAFSYWALTAALTMAPAAWGQMNPDAVTTDLAKDTVAYLEMLTKDAEGNPNPRVACTEGYHYAAGLVAAEMEKLGLEKYGDADRTTYENLVPDSVHPTLCPHGMKNIIGVLWGSEFPDEYVVYTGHLNGPNNYNPETQILGNLDTSDAYDNAISVAIGLAIAKKHQNSPPKRSIVFLFDDGEEGWLSVGVPEIGVPFADVCYYNGKCEGEEKTFYDAVKAQTCVDGPAPLDHCTQDLFDDLENENYNYRGYPIGGNAWIKNPTVDLNQVKAALHADSLGTPPGYSPVMNVLGGNGATFGDEDTMNAFVQSIWPQDTPYVPLYNPKVPPPNYGTLDCFTTYHDSLCKDNANCSTAGGIPSVWLVTQSFQRYHGGESHKVTNQMKGFFQGLTQDYPDLKAELNGRYPSPIYYSQDTMAAMDMALMDELTYTVEELLVNFANSDQTNDLAYSRTPIDADPMLSSMENSQTSLQVIHDGLSAAPEAFSSVMRPIYEDVEARLLQYMVTPDEDMTPEDWTTLGRLSGYGISFAQLLDFFNDKYESKVAFKDEFQVFDKEAAAAADKPAVQTNDSASESKPEQPEPANPAELFESAAYGYSGATTTTASMAVAALASLLMVFC